MRLFGKIMEKLGFNKDVTKAAVANAAAAVKHAARDDSLLAGSSPAAAKPVAISPVDVVKKLEGLAAKNTQKLDWKVSIVDLMKLLGLDISLQARTWPYNTSMLRTVFVSVLIPGGTMIGRTVVELLKR